MRVSIEQVRARTVDFVDVATFVRRDVQLS